MGAKQSVTADQGKRRVAELAAIGKRLVAEIKAAHADTRNTVEAADTLVTIFNDIVDANTQGVAAMQTLVDTARQDTANQARLKNEAYEAYLRADKQNTDKQQRLEALQQELDDMSAKMMRRQKYMQDQLQQQAQAGAQQLSTLLAALSTAQSGECAAIETQLEEVKAMLQRTLDMEQKYQSEIAELDRECNRRAEEAQRGARERARRAAAKLKDMVENVRTLSGTSAELAVERKAAAAQLLGAMDVLVEGYRSVELTAEAGESLLQAEQRRLQQALAALDQAELAKQGIGWDGDQCSQRYQFLKEEMREAQTRAEAVLSPAERQNVQETLAAIGDETELCRMKMVVQKLIDDRRRDMQQRMARVMQLITQARVKKEKVSATISQLKAESQAAAAGDPSAMERAATGLARTEPA